MLDKLLSKLKEHKLFSLKGYKYRAKMLAAAAAILVVLIIIIVFIVHAISSGGSESTDTDTSSATDTEAIASASTSGTASTVSAATTDGEYKFDADGKLIVDTDTLDGQKAVALTFDDGPGEYTEELLEGLEERGAKATFFMLGSCVENYPEVVQLIADGGHQLGNHTYDHEDLTNLTSEEIKEEITKTDDAIFSACGQYSTAFRPPYGSYTDDMIADINKTVTLWSVDSEDWESEDPQTICDSIVSSCYDGDIILMHDIYSTSVEAALLVIDELQAQGYVFVTVDELMTRYGYSITHGVAHSTQYAVYETNSPEGLQYASEIEAQQAESAASEAAESASGEFYYESSSVETDTDTDKGAVSSEGSG